jgi:hypothetical protein
MCAGEPLDLHGAGLARGVVHDGTGSCRIIFSQASHAKMCTSGRPLWLGKASKKRSSFPQNGQASKVLLDIWIQNFLDAPRSATKFIVLLWSLQQIPVPFPNRIGCGDAVTVRAHFCRSGCDFL